MSQITVLHLTLEELCQATSLPTETLIEIVQQGIVEPAGNAPENWQFNTQMIAATKKAYRLHRDLEIDWPGIAFAVNLLDDLEQLREENKKLRQRLRRFVEE